MCSNSSEIWVSLFVLVSFSWFDNVIAKDIAGDLAQIEKETEVSGMY